MTAKYPTYIIRRSIRYRVKAWSKEEALENAKKRKGRTTLTDIWS